MTYNTGKPVPSRDPRDLIDNAESFDIRATSRDVRSTPDRLGVSRKTWYGMEQDFAEFLVASGFEPVHLTYQAGVGLQVDRPTQLIDYSGSVYRVKMPASFPVMLSGTWATDSALLVQSQDQSLRQDLADSTDPAKGAGMVGYSPAEEYPAGTAGNAIQSENGGAVIVLGAGEGVDRTAALQAAIYAWDANPNLSVRIIGEADIQGTVEIPNKETLDPERRLTIHGGSLIKKNQGFMFTREEGQSIGDLQLQTGHVTFDNVRFLGPRATPGTYIVDGDNIIRTKFINCYGDGIQIAYAEQYLQSIYVDTASVFRKWSGWLFDCGNLFDVKFYGTAEAGQSFLRTRDTAADPAANSMTVRGCIEGLVGKVFEVGVCFGVVIDGNYQEGNAGGDFDFSIGTGYHKGLTLIGNGFQPSPAQMADPDYYPVKLGKGAQNSITLIGNSSTHNLFDVAPGNESAIVDIGNWCAAGKRKFSPSSVRLFEFGGTEFKARLMEGVGVNLNTYYGTFGFESGRETIGGESVTPGVGVGAVNPQTSPGDYPQKNWVKGTVILNSDPVVAARQYGVGVVHDALILGWCCTASGTPGTWREIAVMLPY